MFAWPTNDAGGWKSRSSVSRDSIVAGFWWDRSGMALLVMFGLEKRGIDDRAEVRLSQRRSADYSRGGRSRDWGSGSCGRSV